MIEMLAGALLVYQTTKSEREELADRAVSAIAEGINYSRWLREGRSGEVLSASERKMLTAASRAITRYPRHPGIGYYLEKVDAYSKEFQMQLDAEHLEMLKNRPKVDEKQNQFFYDQRAG